MLDRVLSLARQRRAAAAADEVALIEQPEIRLLAAEEVDDRPVPEDPPDHGGGLQRSFLPCRQPIHACGEDGVDGVGNREPFRELVRAQPAVLSLEYPRLQKRTEQLLDEEWVSLGPFYEETSELGGQLRAEQLLEEMNGLRLWKRLEPDRSRVAAAATPRRPAVQELGTRRRQQHERALYLTDDAIEQVEEIVLGPVQILDEHDDRPLGSEGLEEADYGGLELLACIERMKSARDVEPERESEYRVPAEARQDVFRSIAVEDPEVLLEHLAQRPVGNSVAVGETPPGPAERHRLLVCEQLPKLAHEPRLPDTRLAGDRHQVRLSLRDRAPVGDAEQLELVLTADEYAPKLADSAGAHEH